jgi:hypothetical protein
MNDDCRAPRPEGKPLLPRVETKPPSVTRGRVYDAIDSERDFQDRKWGTVEEHPHEVGGWLTIMRQLLRDAEKAWASAADDYTATVEIRKVVAVGVACLEQHGAQTRSKYVEVAKRGTAGFGSTGK